MASFEHMPGRDYAKIKFVTVCSDTRHQRVQTGRNNRKCCSDSNLQHSALLIHASCMSTFHAAEIRLV